MADATVNMATQRKANFIVVCVLPVSTAVLMEFLVHSGTATTVLHTRRGT